jgi:hypothetical protein
MTKFNMARGLRDKIIEENGLDGYYDVLEKIGEELAELFEQWLLRNKI